MEKIKLAGKWKNTIDNLQESFSKNETELQDKEIKEANQKLIDQGYPVNLNDPVSFFRNETTGQMEPRFTPRFKSNTDNIVISKDAVNKLQALLGVNTAVPVTNIYLGNRTPEEYKDYTTPEGIGNVVPLLKKLGSRAYKLGEQYVDNIPGLSSLGENAEDESLGTAGALIQAGGRVLPLAGTFWLGINAGSTAAGTLDEARRRGYTR